MTVSGYIVFAKDEPADIDRLMTRLGTVFSVQEEAAFDFDDQYLDTFDWRLFKGGFSLRRQGEIYLLAPLAGNEEAVEGVGPQKAFLFAADFPEGDFRQRLASLAGPRALLAMVRVVGQGRRFRLRNRDRKTVVRLVAQHAELKAGDDAQAGFVSHLHLEEVRGYGKQYQRAIGLIGKDRWTESDHETLLGLACMAVGKTPGVYNTKVSVPSEGEPTTNQALGMIGLALHRVMEKNLPGVIGDIDPEFLHDLRVAVRRARSLLSQFKKRLPPGQTTVFQRELGWLGSVTGPVRDIDVCLQREKFYQGLLPQELHPGLSRFLAGVRRRREKEFAKMADCLASPRTAKLLDDWREFMTALPTDIQWPAGEVPCREAAYKVVRKAYRRLLDAGHTGHDDEAMHRVRIQGKKFRYMAEFFHEFFPEESMQLLLRELRTLQDHLGDYHDLAVQIEDFTRRRKSMSADGPAGKALAGLIAGLGEEKNRLRLECEKTMDQENLGAFETVFLKEARTPNVSKKDEA